MHFFLWREGLLAFGTERGRVGWVEALQQRPPMHSSGQHQGGVYSVTWGPDGLLYTVGNGTLLQHNTKTGKHVDMQAMRTRGYSVWVFFC